MHAKGYSHIWAWWESDGENNNYTGGKWPGKEMTAEVNSWYSTEIKTAKCNVILSNSGKGQTSEKGDELTAGEWWYKDGEWYDGNPEDSVAPIVISFKSSASGTVSGPLVLTAEVTDNSALKKVVFYIGSKEIGSQDVAGTSATATYEWNTAYVKTAHIMFVLSPMMLQTTLQKKNQFQLQQRTRISLLWQLFLEVLMQKLNQQKNLTRGFLMTRMKGL
ncbi:MAG: starch-binding protein [Treponema sp.]|nr:MAG: starch-binding protein [Treponema sp.]